VGRAEWVFSMVGVVIFLMGVLWAAKKLGLLGGDLRDYMSRQPNFGLAWLGYRIFKWLLGLVVTLIGSLAAFAAVTYPTAADLRDVSGALTLEQLDGAREAWITQIKDLGQVFILTPLFPLLGTVIGYIFGRQARQEGQEPQDKDAMMEKDDHGSRRKDRGDMDNSRRPQASDAAEQTNERQHNQRPDIEEPEEHH
jgi:hypothetical protein